MALELIEGFSGKWQPKKYKDTYTAALAGDRRAKHAGKRSTARRSSSRRSSAGSLRGAARERRAAARRQAASERRAGARANGNGKVDALSRKELEAQATKLGIEGRSKMTKEQLAKAVAKAA